MLKWAGAAYLIWLGIQQWRAAGIAQSQYHGKAQTRGKLFQRAVFVNLTNPKSIVFLAPCSRSLSCRIQPQVMQYLVLSVTTIAVDIIVMIGYATLAQRIAAWIKGPETDEGVEQSLRIVVYAGGRAVGFRTPMPEGEPQVCLQQTGKTN